MNITWTVCKQCMNSALCPLKLKREEKKKTRETQMQEKNTEPKYSLKVQIPYD